MKLQLSTKNYYLLNQINYNMTKDQVRDEIFVRLAVSDPHANPSQCYESAVLFSNVWTNKINDADLLSTTFSSSLMNDYGLTKKQIEALKLREVNLFIPKDNGSGVAIEPLKKQPYQLGSLDIENLHVSGVNPDILKDEIIDFGYDSSKEIETNNTWNRFALTKPPIKHRLELKSDDTAPFCVAKLSKTEARYYELKPGNWKWRLKDYEWFKFKPTTSVNSCNQETGNWKTPKNGKKIHFRTWLGITNEYVYCPFVCIVSSEAIQDMTEDNEWIYFEED